MEHDACRCTPVRTTSSAAVTMPASKSLPYVLLQPDSTVIRKLISSIRHRPKLYKRGNQTRTDSNCMLLWNEVSHEVDLPVSACRHNWRMLLNNFKRRRRHESTKHPIWIYFNDMLFMEKHIDEDVLGSSIPKPNILKNFDLGKGEDRSDLSMSTCDMQQSSLNNKFAVKKVYKFRANNSDHETFKTETANSGKFLADLFDYNKKEYQASDVIQFKTKDPISLTDNEDGTANNRALNDVTSESEIDDEVYHSERKKTYEFIHGKTVDSVLLPENESDPKNNLILEDNTHSVISTDTKAYIPKQNRNYEFVNVKTADSILLPESEDDTKNNLLAKDTTSDSVSEIVLTKSEVLCRLIAAIERRPRLWMHVNANISDKRCALFLWKQVSEEVKLPIDICKFKWRTLRSTFLSKYKDRRTAWIFYEDMRFLEKLWTHKTVHKKKSKTFYVAPVKNVVASSLENAKFKMVPGGKIGELIIEKLDNEEKAQEKANGVPQIKTEDSTLFHKDEVDMSDLWFKNTAMSSATITQDSNPVENQNDDDRAFLLSFLPYMHRLNDCQTLRLRQKLQNAVMEEFI